MSTKVSQWGTIDLDLPLGRGNKHFELFTHSLSIITLSQALIYITMNGFLKFAFTLVVVVFVSCQQEADISGEASDVDTLSYAYHTVDKTVGDCESSCLQIRFKSLNVEDADVIQSQIDSLMLTIGTNAYTSLDAFIQESTEEYARLLEEIPMYDMPWEIERMAVVNYNRAGYFGVSISDYSFTGGAHPNNQHIHRLFTTDDGRMMPWGELTNDEAGLTAYAEGVFRDNKSLSPDASFEAEGYWFENNVFYLPENYLIDDKGIHFFYNTYEVAPYSEGAILLSIDWADFERFKAKGVAFE